MTTSDESSIGVAGAELILPWWYRQAWWQLLVTGSLLGFLFWFPLSWGEGVPVCGFRWLTGQLCPLCGLTHGMAALLRGDSRLAWQSNPLSFLAVAMLLYGFGQAMAAILVPGRNFRLLPIRLRQQVPWLLLFLLFVVEVARWQ